MTSIEYIFAQAIKKIILKNKNTTKIENWKLFINEKNASTDIK